MEPPHLLFFVYIRVIYARAFTILYCQDLDSRLRDRLEETEKEFRKREIETFAEGISIRIAAEDEASRLMQEYRQAISEFEAEFKVSRPRPPSSNSLSFAP